jgi:hypothetical protein
MSIAEHDQRFQPVPRCCPQHPDWQTLASHLVSGFPEIDVTDIAVELRAAKDIVETVDLGRDGIEIAELIVRHRLMLVTGAVVDAARLDPERHDGRAAAKL